MERDAISMLLHYVAEPVRSFRRHHALGSAIRCAVAAGDRARANASRRELMRLVLEAACANGATPSAHLRALTVLEQGGFARLATPKLERTRLERSTDLDVRMPERYRRVRERRSPRARSRRRAGPVCRSNRSRLASPEQRGSSASDRGGQRMTP